MTLSRRIFVASYLLPLAGIAASALAQPATTGPASKPAGETPAKAPPRVALEIGEGDEAWGTIVLELDPDKAPITMENFLRYVDDGFYNGTIFHRTISTFMVQGGGFVNPTEKKTGGVRPPIKGEMQNGLKNLRGTIAMARTPDPDSATCEFFINVVDNAKLDYPSYGGYTVFGKVVEGMDVVDRMKDLPTRRNPMMRGENSMPLTPPVIRKARRAGPQHRVLIVCSGNSSRSQMAEGLWRHLAGDEWDVASAGLEPKDAVNPLAVQVMSEIDIDIRGQKPKPITPFLGQPFDLVVTVCGNAEKNCPAIPNAKRREHWPVENPSEATGDDEDKLKAFRRVRDELKAAIQRELAKGEAAKN